MRLSNRQIDFFLFFFVFLARASGIECPNINPENIRNKLGGRGSLFFF